MIGYTGTEQATRRGAVAVGALAVVLLIVIVAMVAILSGGSGGSAGSAADAGSQNASNGTQAQSQPEAGGSEPEQPVMQVMPEADRVAVIERARGLVNAGELGQAAAELATEVAAHPDDGDLRLARAEVLGLDGKFAEALGEQLEAIRIGPASAAMHFQAGVFADLAERGDLAVEQYFAAHQKDQSNAQYLVYLGQAEMDQNENGQALAHLSAALQLAPENAVIYGLLAEVQLRQNNPSVAAQLAGQAREREPQNTGYRVIEARALKRDGRPGEALERLDGIRSEDRYLLVVLQQRAECFGLLQLPEEAAAMFAGASDTFPENASMAFEAAVWLERLGEIDRAMTYAERSARLGNDAAVGLLERLASSDAG